MKKIKTVLQVFLATALVASPLVIPPKAYAIDDLYVDADSEKTGAKTGYTIELELEEELSKNEKIYIEFDKYFDLDSTKIKKNIELNGDDVTSSKVSVSGKKITITAEENFDDGDKINIEIGDGITNPVSADKYTVSVSTSNETKETYKVNIKKSSSSSGNKSKSKSYDDFDISLGSYKVGETTNYEIGTIDLEDKLKNSAEIIVTFPDKNMLPKSMRTRDLEVNGVEPKKVSINGKEVTITLPSSFEKDMDDNYDLDELFIEFSKSAGIENPDTAKNYTIDIKYKGTSYTSEKFEITKSSSSSSGSSSSSTGSNFDVTLSNRSGGERSSYSFELDFGKNKLTYNTDIVIEFPADGMLEGYIDKSAVTINGKSMKGGVYPSGRTLTITTPNDFVSNSTAKISFSYYAYVKNPLEGTYTLKAKAAGKSFTSKSFTVSGGSVTTPTTPTIPTIPTTPVNNSLATIALTKSTLNTPTGITVGIKGLGMPLVKNRDFLELALPAGFRVPATVNTAAISVNGLIPGYVVSRGQNLVIYPSQDIAA